MKSLVFATPEEAEARSRAEWEKVLGRPIQSGDLTQFFFAVDGAALLIPADEEWRLTADEAGRLRAPVDVAPGASEVLDRIG